MIRVTQYNGYAVAVLGLGRSGLTAARALKAGGATPICWDDNEDSLSAAEAEGFLIANLHAEHVWSEHSFAALILSPGIPHLYPEANPIVKLAWEHRVLVDNDVSLFFEALNHREEYAQAEPLTVCITGSNGKSTTTALITHILETAGRNCQMGGNIGRGVLDLEPPREDEIYVVELSSYQTEMSSVLHPVISVFLNFSPDHYDRHGGRGGYYAAKRRLIENTLFRVIIGVDDDEGQFLANNMQRSRPNHTIAPFVTPISVTKPLRHWSRWIALDEGVIVEGGSYEEAGDPGQVEEIARLDLSTMPNLKGVHNHQNACAAYEVCRAVGLEVSDIEVGMKTFPGLPHRMETVGQLGNISFINDSKATNVESAAKALDAFKNIYWIAGGQGKEGGLSGLEDYFHNIKKAYLIGETAQEFADLLDDTPHFIAGTLEQALALAVQDADADGETSVILLAPACASFDQFPSFEHRGNSFREQALALISKDQ